MSWLVVASPLPSFDQVTQLRLSDLLSTGGVTVFVLLYSIYNVLCISLALEALRRRNVSVERMTDVARHRARPWMLATSVVLLAVSLLVALLLLLIVFAAGQRTLTQAVSEFTYTIAVFDLLIDALILIAVLAIGQAIISYEVFTGKTLPRRGLLRQWRNAIILAAGFSLVISWSLTAPLRPIYGLLLSTLILAIFYALFGWRSYAERERYTTQLRPFVASQRLYEKLLTPTSAPDESDADKTFHALCMNVLNVRVAYLIAQGPMSALFGAPLMYPENNSPPKMDLVELIVTAMPTLLSMPIDPQQFAGAVWAVPLWSERGLIGMLLLGEKRDGGLYAQEEIEIARATGERLIDIKAAAEMARRLIALQRQRLTEGQVMDRRARRALHDEILPRLHTALLNLNGAAPDAINLLTEVHREISDLLRELPPAITPQIARRGLVGALKEEVGSEFEQAFEGVTWEIEADAEPKAKTIPALTAEVIFYATREAVRNAARYGRNGDSARPLHLNIRVAWRDGLEIIVQDDGIGVSGSTPSDGGAGQGLALHGTMMAIVGGVLTMESAQGEYTRVALTLPQSSY
jgi:signal transduction histidine kinase